METPPKDNVTKQAGGASNADAAKALSPAEQQKADRAQRLASALRQNLKRRKVPKTTSRPVDQRN